jgi:hypothetical protein
MSRENRIRTIYRLQKTNPFIEIESKIRSFEGVKDSTIIDTTALTLSPETSTKVVNIYLNLLKKIEEKTPFNKIILMDNNSILPLGAELVQGSQKNGIIAKNFNNTITLSQPLNPDDRTVIIGDVLIETQKIQNIIDIVKKSNSKVVAGIFLIDRQLEDKNNTTAKILLEKNNPEVKIRSYVNRDILTSWGFMEPDQAWLENKDALNYINDKNSRLTLNDWFQDTMKDNKNEYKISEIQLRNMFVLLATKNFLNACLNNPSKK